MARPTKYRPEYGQLLLDEMKMGKSLTQCATVLNVSIKTLYNWAEEYPDFKDCIDRANESAQAYYESKLQEFATNPDIKVGNATAKMLELLLTARFKKDYTRASVQHQEITVNHVAKMSEDQLDEQIQRLLGNASTNPTKVVLDLKVEEYSSLNSTDQDLSTEEIIDSIPFYEETEEILDSTPYYEE